MTSDVLRLRAIVEVLTKQQEIEKAVAQTESLNIGEDFTEDKVYENQWSLAYFDHTGTLTTGENRPIPKILTIFRTGLNASLSMMAYGRSHILLQENLNIPFLVGLLPSVSLLHPEVDILYDSFYVIWSSFVHGSISLSRDLLIDSVISVLWEAKELHKHGYREPNGADWGSVAAFGFAYLPAGPPSDRQDWKPFYIDPALKLPTVETTNG